MKWEYRIEMAHGFIGVNYNVDNLNKLGTEEWEAVGVWYDSKYSQTFILFKKPQGEYLVSNPPDMPSKTRWK